MAHGELTSQSPMVITISMLWDNSVNTAYIV